MQVHRLTRVLPGKGGYVSTGVLAVSHPLTRHCPRTSRHTPLGGNSSSPSRVLGARAFTLDPIIQGAQDLVVHFHVVSGLPWYVVIPGVTAMLNFTIRLPFMFWERRRVIRHQTFVPIMAAWKSRYEATRSPEAREELRRCAKQYALKPWAILPSLFLHLPSLILFSEVIRTLSGGPTLSALFSGGESTVERALDVGLETGGALWFTDLTAADPTGTLPILLGASFFWTLIPKDSETRRRVLDVRLSTNANLNWKNRIIITMRRTMLLVFPLMCFLARGAPSAMFLYFLPVTVLRELNGALVRRLWPMPPVFRLPPPTEALKGVKEKWYIKGPKRANAS